MALSAGRSHALGLKEDSSIVAWGYNAFHQAEPPDPNTDFVAVAGGGDHSLALKSDGSIVAWGHNGRGQLDVPAPNSGFSAVAGGMWHSLGLRGSLCDACDMNCDGDVDAFDIEPFLGILFGGGQPCGPCTGDVNEDGNVDAFDIEPLLNCLFP